MEIQWVIVCETCCFYYFIKVYESQWCWAQNPHTEIPSKRVHSAIRTQSRLQVVQGKEAGRGRVQVLCLPASQGALVRTPLVLNIMARLATPSCWDCCIVLLECKDAKEGMPPGLLRDTSSSIPSCLPERSLLLGQSCSTWECPFLSLPLPKVYQQLAQGRIMNSTHTPSKSPPLSTCSWEKEKVPWTSVFKITVV